MTISLRFAARSDVGLVRQSNQDSGYAGPHLCLLCDGMGGPAGGDIASAVAVEHLMPLDADSHQAGELLGLMRDAVQAAHTELVTLSSQDPDLAGLGTTCIGVMRSGNKLAMVHVGDSRAYMLRDGTLTQVTTDHTFVEYLVETGRLTRDQARQHPQRSVLLRVLGDTEGEVQLDESIREAVPGDRWLLCSDGLSGPVTAETIGEVLAGVADPGQAADQLIDLALRAGGPDNVTAVVFDVVKDDPEPQTVPQVVGSAATERLAQERAAAAHRAGDEQSEAKETEAASPAAKAAAQRHGYRFADPSGSFAGHELCGKQSSWFDGLINDGRFHPNAAGHKAMASSIMNTLNNRQAAQEQPAAAQAQVDNTRPAGSFTLTRNGAQLALDASASTDSDGTITNIDWYIQRADGSEEILTGEQAVPFFRDYVLDGALPSPELLRRVRV